jgi:predicted nucleotidyltransferase
MHKREHYISIESKRDVVEYPIIDEVDINGWDIRKALQLFQK